MNLGFARFAHEGSDHGRGNKFLPEFAALVAKLRAPSKILGESGVEVRARGNRDDALLERLRGAEAFRVPRRNFAEKLGAIQLPIELAITLEVSAHHAKPLLKIGFGKQLARAQVMIGATENPGIVEGAAPHAYSGTSGFVLHVLGRFWGRDIAIADHGD